MDSNTIALLAIGIPSSLVVIGGLRKYLKETQVAAIQAAKDAAAQTAEIIGLREDMQKNCEATEKREATAQQHAADVLAKLNDVQERTVIIATTTHTAIARTEINAVKIEGHAEKLTEHGKRLDEHGARIQLHAEKIGFLLPEKAAERRARKPRRNGDGE